MFMGLRIQAMSRLLAISGDNTYHETSSQSPRVEQSGFRLNHPVSARPHSMSHVRHRIGTLEMIAHAPDQDAGGADCEVTGS
jgi:hypothetical protein